MPKTPEQGEFNSPEIKEIRLRPFPPIAELLAVAYAKPSAESSADAFIERHGIHEILGRVLDSRGEADHFGGDYQTPDSEVVARLDYDWTYNLSSKEEGGDNEGMCFVISGEHSVDMDGRSLEYAYTVFIPDDSRLVSEAGHNWKILDATGIPIDGPEYKPEQMDGSGNINHELFITLLQRGCEDLAHTLQ